MFHLVCQWLINACEIWHSWHLNTNGSKLFWWKIYCKDSMTKKTQSTNILSFSIICQICLHLSIPFINRFDIKNSITFIFCNYFLWWSTKKVNHLGRCYNAKEHTTQSFHYFLFFLKKIIDLLNNFLFCKLFWPISKC